MSANQPTRVLILQIEVPGIWADDLEESAKMFGEGDAADRLEVVTSELMRRDVGITIVTWPSEKSMNHDFEVHGYTGHIVGAETRPISGHSGDDE